MNIKQGIEFLSQREWSIGANFYDDDTQVMALLSIARSLQELTEVQKEIKSILYEGLSLKHGGPR